MIRNTKDLSLAEKAVIESLLGRELSDGEAVRVRAMPPVPTWLQEAWKGAKRRGIDRLTGEEVQQEIDAYRREKCYDPGGTAR